GIIALTKVALETGILPITEPTTTIVIDTPAGRVVATASVFGGVVRGVRFRNVPSFVLELDARVEGPGLGDVGYDLAFGGAFYAYVDVSAVGLTCTPADASRLIEMGRLIKKEVSASREIRHPVEDDLGFLYGVIFVGPAEDPAHHSRNVCVFADGELDRSPTGTGVSGRLSIHHARGELEVGETIVVESIVGSTFTGTVVETKEFGGYPAVIPEIGGQAHLLGRTEFWIDPDDRLGEGFLLR
ncbi:MAG: proline racemase family protein, partial [Acidimicrobiia bacterium]